MNKNLVAAIGNLNSALDNHFLVQPGAAFEANAFAAHYDVSRFDLDEQDIKHCNDVCNDSVRPELFRLEENELGKHRIRTFVLNVNFDGTWYYANNEAGDVGAAWNPETDDLRTGEPYSTWA